MEIGRAAGGTIRLKYSGRLLFFLRKEINNSYSRVYVQIIDKRFSRTEEALHKTDGDFRFRSTRRTQKSCTPDVEQKWRSEKRRVAKRYLPLPSLSLLIVRNFFHGLYRSLNKREEKPLRFRSLEKKTKCPRARIYAQYESDKITCRVFRTRICAR